MVSEKEIASACAIKFLADLLRAARNDSTKNPLRYLETKLGKYEKIADTILANSTYQTWMNGRNLSSEA
jgi:hypothetical protein